jgi:hypothetical protein
MADPPTVSALMAAYNYEQYVGRAIESALNQDYPPELLDVVVIDDGSTDSTADVVRALAERHPGRVRLVQQENAGYVAATNRALSEGGGEMLALLDADDVWLPAKTRRQVEMLQDRPELGMVFSDMVVVDSEEETVRPSLIWHLDEVPERAFARVLHENIATQSSIMIRSTLREQIAPIPAAITYADWWVTLRCAQVSRIDFSREPLALYRVHGANLTGDVTMGPAAVRERRKGIAFQLWVMRNLPLDGLDAAETASVWNNTEERARRVVEAAGSQFVQVAELAPEAERSRVEELLGDADRLREAGDLDGEARAALRALACDPFRLGARERLGDVVARADALEATPHPLRGARGFVVLVDAEDLLAGDELLGAYAQAMAGDGHATLAIDATRLEAHVAGPQLEALVARCGLSEREDIAMLAVVGELDPAQRHRMLAGVHARYGTVAPSDGPPAGAPPGVPAFTAATLGQLRALAGGG